MYRVVGVQFVSLYYPSRLTEVQIKYLPIFFGNVADFTLLESKRDVRSDPADEYSQSTERSGIALLSTWLQTRAATGLKQATLMSDRATLPCPSKVRHVAVCICCHAVSLI